jgi:LysM repeat protein
VVFPNQFPGYHLRDESRSYTTPEVVGALLDAIEAVRTQFPDTCDLFLGDFSCGSGGSAIHHRSHQNGRDVDVGMYAKGNRPLNSFVPMGEDNLDAAKTWCLMENLIASQRVQYIFLDRRVQKVLYEYALTRGYDQEYLQRVFGNVRGSLVQHVRNHFDHMHVRFFTPWSTLAAHIGADEAEKRAVIEVAQQSYLPRKVNYYVNGSEKGLDELAHSFGVRTGDLCRWNHINGSSVLVPGSCLVFYKRSFESEPVMLARSLQPGFIAQAPPVKMASLQPEPEPATVSDSTSSEDSEPVVKEKQAERPATPTVTYRTCKARKGDTLDKIAHRNKLDVKLLCRLNGIKKTAALRPGQTVRTAAVKVYAVADRTTADESASESSASSISSPAEPGERNSGAATVAYYTVKNGGNLQDVSKKTGVPVSSLCKLNRLDRDTPLKPGQKIKTAQANLEVAVNKSARESSSSSADVSSGLSKSDSSTADYYVVKNGGTLQDVSKKTGVPVSSLCKLNRLDRDTALKPGQKIKIAQANLEVAANKSVRESSSSSADVSSGLSKSGSSTADYYVVKNGGTLQDVSKKTGVPVSSLCKLNRLDRDAALKPGQKIKVAQTDQKAPADTSKRKSSSSICFTSDSKKPDSPTAAYYTVNNGGTLQDVSKKTGIPLSSLCQLNGLDRNARLKSGQRIKLTQANLPVKPSLGSAACSPKDSGKKAAGAKHDRSNKKPLKPGEAKAAQKSAVKTAASKNYPENKGRAKTASARNATKKQDVTGKNTALAKK